jgi:hypothetical protein
MDDLLAVSILYLQKPALQCHSVFAVMITHKIPAIVWTVFCDIANCSYMYPRCEFLFFLCHESGSGIPFLYIQEKDLVLYFRKV